MSSSVYARLGFSFPDPIANTVIQPLSSEVEHQMNTMPIFLNSWQQEDVATGNTAGYYVNPMSDVITLVKNSAISLVTNTPNTVTGDTNTITSLITSALNYANTIKNSTADGFLYHTNRLSNVTGMDSNITEPHFDTAMGIGKMMMYLTYQTDGVQNNSPMLGSFTSLFIANTLSDYETTASALSIVLNNSITFNPFGNTYSSNISLSNAQALSNAYYNLYITMTNYRNQDNTFFQNSSYVLNDFNKVRAFSTMGQTENYLITNYIGSPKLLSRLQSEQ